MNGRRFLVVGSDGLIGQALFRHLSERHQRVIGTTRRRNRVSSNQTLLDLDQDIISWEPPEDCSTGFLCAAATSQEHCRRHSDVTRQLNVTKTAALARILVDAGMFVVFLSTNLVFDGRDAVPNPGDPTNPQTEYGRQKTLAERALLEMGEKVAIVRLSKIFHPEMPLIKKWAVALEQSETIYPLSDLVCSPIPLDFTVNALYRIGAEEEAGIFQVSGERDVSYAEIALRLARRLEADEKLVQPSTSRQLGLRLEHLPAHTTMNVSRVTRQLGLTFPTVEATLDSVFGNILRA